MRDRLHGYSPAEVDRLIWRVFSEWPDEAFVARQLGVHVRDVSGALERFATRVAVLADQHWQERVLAQVNELQKISDRLCAAEDPPHASVALRVRIAALRQALLLTTETPAVAELAPVHAAAAPRQEMPTTAAMQSATSTTSSMKLSQPQLAAPSPRRAL
jgi:hypothetical protein